MSHYINMATVYDALMADAPYDKWVDFVIKHVTSIQKPHEETSLLDVGCGTGELVIRLKKHGFLVMGVDLSETMLAIARQKAEIEGLKIPLFHQDMTSLQVEEPVDIITIFCDSLNYLLSKEDVINTFKACYESLNTGGMILIDVHSPYKMEQFLMNEPFYQVGEDVTYIWNCQEGNDPLSVTHDLTFFVLNEVSGEYQRFDEWHQQRTYPIDEWNEMLSSVGFSSITLQADFTNEPDETSERIFFCAKK
ncbi:class I SAM-dependent methyltransferase [Bacillus carboniphilus]